MRFLPALLLSLLAFNFSFGQNEQSPIVEKPLAYRDWTYKNINGSGETNLREFTHGKKLVMVVYWAPWCPNWKHDVAFVQSLHAKYAGSGLAVIGVGEYDPVGKMKDFIDQYKITFPNVYESDSTAMREKTVHFTQRREAGDTRKWGSPWYIFLDPKTLEPNGEFLTKNTTLVNGELIRPDAEKFIQQKLGISAAGLAVQKTIDACDPGRNVAKLKVP